MHLGERAVERAATVVERRRRLVIVHAGHRRWPAPVGAELPLADVVAGLRRPDLHQRRPQRSGILGLARSSVGPTSRQMNDDDQRRGDPSRMPAKVPRSTHHVSHYTPLRSQIDVVSCTCVEPPAPHIRDLERVRAARLDYSSTVWLGLLVGCHVACRSHEASHFTYTYI